MRWGATHDVHVRDVVTDHVGPADVDGVVGGCGVEPRVGTLPPRVRARRVRPKGDDVDLAEAVGVAERVVEVDAPDASIARHLAAHGRTRYLALVAPRMLGDVREDAGELAPRVRSLAEAPDVRRLGADVLVMHGRAQRHLWTPRDLGAVRLVLVEATGRAVEAAIARRLQQRSGNLRPHPDVHVDGRRFHAVELAHRPPRRPRAYLSPVVGPAGLFRRLDEEGVRYVVLRWFEGLPTLDPGEDLDVLVADEDLETLHAVLAEEPGTIPVDVYSETGLPGADHQGIAYYPPHLARRMLDRAVRHPSGARVPAPDDHLHSLAYHALYHKGVAAGVPSRLLDAPPGATPEHDYAAALAEVAAGAGIDLPHGMEAVDDHLAAHGWQPPYDTLLRLSGTNAWIHRRFFDEAQRADDPPEPAVLVLRRRAREVLTLDEIVDLVTHLGFEVLAHRELDADMADRCATTMRGGNWGRGPYPSSGGPPAELLVLAHYGPRRPDAATRDRYPHLTNVDVLEAKERLRDIANARLPADQHCNPVHSSDNPAEAWAYVTTAMPDQLEVLQGAIDERRAEFRPQGPVERVLRRGRRARVELVEHDGGLAVRKTFGRAHLRHLERERVAATELAAVVDAVPPLLASGDNWVLVPFYTDTLGYEVDHPRLVPLPLLRAMVDVLRQVHDQGFALVDAKPDNFLLDDDGRLHLVDFEFLHRYPGTPPPFEDSYTLRGASADVVEDVPVGPLHYDRTWLPWTGLRVDELCHAPPWRQRVGRARYRLRRLAGALKRRVLAVPRGVRAALQRVRAEAGQRYRDWARRRALS